MTAVLKIEFFSQKKKKFSKLMTYMINKFWFAEILALCVRPFYKLHKCFSQTETKKKQFIQESSDSLWFPPGPHNLQLSAENEVSLPQEWLQICWLI